MFESFLRHTVIKQTNKKINIIQNRQFPLFKGIPNKDINIENLTVVINTLITYYFASLDVIASQPIITITSDLIRINVGYYTGELNVSLNSNAINSIGLLLSRVFNRQVELRLYKLHYPFIDANILAEFISEELKISPWNIVIQNLTNSIVPLININDSRLLPHYSYLIGLRVELSGRLINAPTIPRQTTNTFTIGSFSNSANTTIGKFISDNTKGAYTIKVYLCQHF